MPDVIEFNLLDKPALFQAPISGNTFHGLNDPRHVEHGLNVGDGVSDATAAVMFADAQPRPHMTSGVFLVSGISLLKQWSVDRGAMFKVSAGATLTMPVPDAGPYQIFDCSASGASVSFSTAGTVYPEWFGLNVGTGDDDNAAMIAMVTAITVQGTTVWLNPDKTYHVSNLEVMSPINASAGWSLYINGIGVNWRGWGTLSRMPVVAPATAGAILKMENCTDFTFEVRTNGRESEIPSAEDLDVVMFMGCTRFSVPRYASNDSSRHGINFTDCSEFTYGDVVSYDARKYGVSMETPRYSIGGTLMVRGSKERWAHELTDGARDIVAPNVLAYGSLGGVQLGSHQVAGQSSAGIVYPVVYVNGVDPSESVPVGTEPTLAQIVTTVGCSIQGDTHDANNVLLPSPNVHEDTTIGILDVHYATEAGLSAELVRRLTVNCMRLRNNKAANSSFGAVVANGGEVLFLGGYVRGFGRMMYLLKCERVIIRNMVFEDNTAKLLITDCEDVEFQGCTWVRNTPSDYLVEVNGAAGHSMNRLAFLNCTIGTGPDANSKVAARINLGSTGTLAEYHQYNTKGLLVDVVQPGGYQPVQAFYTDDQTFRTFPVNSANPRVDRTANWMAQNTSATTYTTFIGIRDGMEFTVYWNDALTTLANSAQFSLIGGTRTSTVGKFSRFKVRGSNINEILYV